MISMEMLGKIPANVLPRQALAASHIQAYRAVEEHHPKMGQSARSNSAGVPAQRNLQQTQPMPQDAGTSAEGRFIPGKAQPQERQSTFRADQGRGL